MNNARSRLVKLSPLARGRRASARTRSNQALLKESQRTVKQRDNNRCFVCGARSTQVHHRHPRKMGGSTQTWVNMPANLICVCNTCHSRIESERVWAVNRGYLVPYFRRPDDWPVQTRDDQWALLTDTGEIIRLRSEQVDFILDNPRTFEVR